MIRTVIATVSLMLVCAMDARAEQPALSGAAQRRCEAVQGRFIEARARQDVDAMAAVFAQDAIRVTPEGVFQGRDAIRGNLASVAALGLHDFTSERTVSRWDGTLLFVAGAWQAKVGDAPLHGYYSALLSCASDHPEMVEETTNVATPPRR